MEKKFTIKQKCSWEDEHVNISLRIPISVREKLDELAAISCCSRNKVALMALEYALENLELVSKKKP